LVVRLGHRNTSPKLSGLAVQELLHSPFRCGIVYTVKVDGAQQVAASIQNVEAIVRHWRAPVEPQHPSFQLDVFRCDFPKSPVAAYRTQRLFRSSVAF
jgi:hypothetical protein